MNPVCHYARSHDSGPARFWILDIDGTLMHSQQLDNECYWRAVFGHFDEPARTLDLHDFEHVTDGSILDEWMQQTRGRSATAGELRDIRQRFLELIRQASESHPGAFTASTGLTDWLDQTLAAYGPCIAVATGGWGHTARHKLAVAGLSAYDLPLASSDDGDNRCAIMRHAQQLLAGDKHAGRADDPPPTCYIGDGLWDLRASRQLGWDFIGIAQGAQARTLQQAGAEHVFCNFAELLASKPLSVTARVHPFDATAL